MNKCVICFKEFEPSKNHPHQQTCSKKCCSRWHYLRNKKKYNKPKKNYVERKCHYCGKKYKPKSFIQKYCSNKCSKLAFNKKRKKHILKKKLCKHCRKLFLPDKRHPQAKFCSEKCNKAYNFQIKYKKYKLGWVTIKYCKECGKKIVFDKSKPMNTELIRNYCSNKCRGSASHKRFKYNSPKKYKEKIKRRRQTEIYKIRHRLDAKKRNAMKKGSLHKFSLKQWTEKLERTKGICPMCKKFVGVKNLELDHIFPLSKAYKDYQKTGKKKSYEIRDIQPLCRKCNNKKADKIIK